MKKGLVVVFVVSILLVSFVSAGFWSDFINFFSGEEEIMLSPSFECGDFSLQLPLAAEAVSVYDDSRYGITNAFDGNINNYWLSSAENKAGDRWIILDLGEEKCVNSADLAFYWGYGPVGFNLSYSSDGESWQNLGGYTHIDAAYPTNFQTFDFSETVSARYIKIEETSAKYASFYGILSEAKFNMADVTSSSPGGGGGGGGSAYCQQPVGGICNVGSYEVKIGGIDSSGEVTLVDNSDGRVICQKTQGNPCYIGDYIVEIFYVYSDISEVSLKQMSLSDFFCVDNDGHLDYERSINFSTNVSVFYENETLFSQTNDGCYNETWVNEMVCTAEGGSATTLTPCVGAPCVNGACINAYEFDIVNCDAFKISYGIHSYYLSADVITGYPTKVRFKNEISGEIICEKDSGEACYIGDAGFTILEFSKEAGNEQVTMRAISGTSFGNLCLSNSEIPGGGVEGVADKYYVMNLKVKKGDSRPKCPSGWSNVQTKNGGSYWTEVNGGSENTAVACYKYSEDSCAAMNLKVKKGDSLPKCPSGWSNVQTVNGASSWTEVDGGSENTAVACYRC